MCVCCFLLPCRRCPSFLIFRYLLKRTGNLFLLFHQELSAKWCWNGLVFEASVERIKKCWALICLLDQVECISCVCHCMFQDQDGDCCWFDLETD